MKLNRSFEQLLKKSFLMLFMKILGALLSFMLTAMITRTLGAEESGSYFFIVSALLFFCSITSLGFNNAIIKLGSLEKNTYNYCRMLGDMTVFVFCITLLVVAIAQLFMATFPYFNHDILNSYFIFLAILIFPFSMCQIISGFFISKNNIFLASLYLNIGYQLILLCMLFISRDFGLSLLFEYLVLSLYSLIFVFVVILRLKFGHIIVFEFKKMIHRGNSIFKLSSPMMLSQWISQLNNFSGLLLISFFASAADIAYYSVSMRVAVLLSFFAAALSKVASRNFAKLYEEGNINELKSLVAFSNRFLFLSALPFLLTIVFFGQQVLLLFGDEFNNSYILLVILSLGQFVSAMTGTVYNLLQMTGNEKKLAKALTISTVLSICIGSILVPIYGVTGGAIMTSVSLLANSFISCYLVNKTLGINPFMFFSTVKQ